MGIFALLTVSIAITLLGYAVVDLIGELVHRGGDGGVEEK